MNNIADIINITADKAHYALKENSVLGDPITVDGIMIIPVYKVSYGFGGGGFDGIGSKKPDAIAAGAGAGVTKKPISYITIQDGKISVLSAEETSNNGIFSKALELLRKRS